MSGPQRTHPTPKLVGWLCVNLRPARLGMNYGAVSTLPRHDSKLSCSKPARVHGMEAVCLQLLLFNREPEKGVRLQPMRFFHLNMKVGWMATSLSSAGSP